MPDSTPFSVPPDLPDQVRRALAEDLGSGDVTAALIPAERAGRATVITREAAIVCGIPYVNETFAQIDPAVRLEWRVAEGDAAVGGQTLFAAVGSARSLLTGERTALNFLQLLSGTATAARSYVALIEDLPCQVLDTRKTLPGLRTAQKYAVRVAGGRNHRVGLFDLILVKENHIMAAGSIAQAVARARASDARVPIEVEVETLSELGEAIAAGPDIVMLDEFSVPDLRAAVAVNRQAAVPVKLEASGGVTLKTLRDIALTGVDFISVGSITKHVQAIDLSMRFDWQD